MGVVWGQHEISRVCKTDTYGSYGCHHDLVGNYPVSVIPLLCYSCCLIGCYRQISLFCILMIGSSWSKWYNNCIVEPGMWYLPRLFIVIDYRYVNLCVYSVFQRFLVNHFLSIIVYCLLFPKPYNIKSSGYTAYDQKRLRWRDPFILSIWSFCRSRKLMMTNWSKDSLIDSQKSPIIEKVIIRYIKL